MTAASCPAVAFAVDLKGREKGAIRRPVMQWRRAKVQTLFRMYMTRRGINIVDAHPSLCGQFIILLGAVIAVLHSAYGPGRHLMQQFPPRLRLKICHAATASVELPMSSKNFYGGRSLCEVIYLSSQHVHAAPPAHTSSPQFPYAASAYPLI